MAKRKSEAATILNFFRDAPLPTAQFAFDQVKDVMRERAPKKEKKPSTKKKGPAAVPETQTAAD